MTDNTAPTWRQVRVSFRKQVSDGNYGTESAEVSFEDYVDGTTDDADNEDFLTADAMLNDARRLVHQQLHRSPSQRVRQSLSAPKQEPKAAFIGPPAPPADDEVPF